ncbi:cilia- and flagella-associated protein 206 [Culicoides brevitarsis]|uniref:cilia- and flagella-associated protein 206 n=1 Tax=Culicoides brevitarsis TaxID=469753 RepID=UPI00307B4236
MALKIKKLQLNSSNLTKNIVREIIRELDDQNVKGIEKSFVEYVVDLLSLNNSVDFSKSVINRNLIEEFIDRCIAKICDQSAPSTVALKMQAYFFENFIERDEIIGNYMKQMMAKTATITKEITEAEVVSRDDQDELIKKIIIDIITKSSLGNPNDSLILTETSNALHSVMSRVDIENFIALNKNDRVNSLVEIREIVTGIILFNQDAGNSSITLMELPQILEQSYESTKSILQITLCEILDRINLLTSAISSAISNDFKNRQIIVLLPQNVTAEDFETVKNSLIMNRQHEIFTRKLSEFLENVKLDIDKNNHRYNETLKLIHETVQFRTAIPTEKVFPKFAELSKCWSRLQNNIYLLSEINQINNQLLQLSEKAVCCDEIAYKLLGDSVIETDEERSARYKDKKISLLGDNCSVQPYNKKMKLEYYGFCTWMLSQGRGILIPGLPETGIIVYRNANYAFSSPEVALMFEDTPEKLMYKIIETAKNRIELIRLLDIYDQMKSFEVCSSKVDEGSCELVKQTNDQEVQTELHPIPYHKDERYMWNIWDIRKKAIQLANLRKCATTSAQTMLSYQKYNVNVQTNRQKNSAKSQTSTESYTQKSGFSFEDDLSSCLEVTKLQ